MDASALFEELVIVFGTALIVVLVLHRLRLPVIAGFIIAGAILGPGALGWVRDPHTIHQMAEIGVVLLLFTIGLELSPGTLRRIGREIALGGTLQVTVTTLCVTAAVTFWSADLPRGLFWGFLVALSSTAIVLRALSERGETDAPHGRLVLGILIFQDLLVVPLMLITPLLAGEHRDAWALPRVLGEAAVVVAATLILAKLAVPRLLGLVARTGRRDLFLLAVLLVCVGVGWLTALLGLSLALGAFLAGAVLAGSDFQHQALSDVLPLRDLFTSLFFISMGLLLDVQTLVRRPLLVLGAVVAVLLLKSLAVGAVAFLLRAPPRSAILAAVALSQIGEFSFVLAGAGERHGLLSSEHMRFFLAASAITMLVTPLLLRFGPALAAALGRLRGFDRAAAAGDLASHSASMSLSGHVVVLGYGVGGELLAGALRAGGHPYAIVDLNANRIRAARRRGEPAWYGDVTQTTILEKVRVRDAREIVLMINDPDATERAVRAVRRLAPDIPITARARYVADVALLEKAGATDVIAQEYEASLEIVARVLLSTSMPSPQIDAHILEALRRRRLPIPQLARSGAGLESLPVLTGLRIETFLVRESSWVAGRTVTETALRNRTGATLVAVGRAEGTVTHPSAADVLRCGDLLYIVGAGDRIASAFALLERGAVGSVGSDPRTSAPGPRN